MDVSHYDERLAAWKAYLPVVPEGPVLAVGLDSAGLLSLARSWRHVHAWRCGGSDVGIAAVQAERQDIDTDIKTVGDSGLNGHGYHAIAVRGALSGADADALYGRLLPGGALIHVGGGACGRRLLSLGSVPGGRASEYALLPARDPKVIIPLASPAMTLSGLRFYLPRRRYRRMWVRIGGLALRAGVPGLLGRRRMIKVTKPGALPGDAYLLDWIGRLIGTRACDAAAYIGNNRTPRRRLTLQVFDYSGRAVSVVKVADTEDARDVSSRETAALSAISQAAVLRGSIPNVISHEDWQGYSVMAQGFVPMNGIRYPAGLTPAHVSFLESLGRVGRNEMRLLDWPKWREIEAWSMTWPFASKEEGELAGKTVRWLREDFGETRFVFHRAHGDFTPWNALVTDGGGLMVFDWEYSTPFGLPFYDLAYFALKTHEYSKGRRLSLAELFSLTTGGLGVEDHILTLSRSLPNFSNLTAQRRQGLLKAHMALIFALLYMGNIAAS